MQRRLPGYVRSDMTDATIATIEARTGRAGEATLAGDGAARAG